MKIVSKRFMSASFVNALFARIKSGEINII